MRKAHRVKSTAHLILGATMMGTSFLHLENSAEPKAWLVLLLAGLLTVMLELPEVARMDTDAAHYDTPERAAMRGAFEEHYRRAGWPGSTFARTAEGMYAVVTMNDAWRRWQEHEEFLASLAEADPQTGDADFATPVMQVPAAPMAASPAAAVGMADELADNSVEQSVANSVERPSVPSVPAAGHTDILPGFVHYCEERDNFFDTRTHERKGPEFYLRWQSRSHEFPKAPRTPADEPQHLL